MKQRIQNKKRIACLCGYFVFVAFLSYTLGKYIQNVKTAIQVEVAVSDYERVCEADAPYEDEFGTYYIHYTGEKSGEERTKVDIAEDMKDGKICGTVLSNTYKLFSGCSSKIDRVILADGMASVLFDKDTFKGTSQDIQLIYRDSTKTIDRTNTVFENKKIMTYLYLTPGHLEDDVKYTGTVKNIFVSKEIDSLQGLFIGSQTLEYALFDENETWSNMDDTFLETKKFHVTNYGFDFPQQITYMSNTFAHSVFNDADLEAIQDKIPDTVKDMSGTFRDNALTKIPEGFKFPKDLVVFSAVFSNTQLTTVGENMILPSTVEDAIGVFQNCSLLETVPAGLFSKMNGEVIDVGSAFFEDEKLRGYIEMPKENVNYIENIFQGAGTSSENLPNYSTPIVMVYNPDDLKSAEYAETYTAKTNIYDKDKNPDGKVTAITYDQYNLKNHFEKVTGEGPYTDADGKNYYLRYVGPDKRVDLNDYVLPSGKIYWRDQEINSTYKLFEEATNIDRVIMIDDFKDKELNNNMFEGTSQDIQLIYRDGTSPTDKTDTLFSNNKVMTYLYLIPEYLEDGRKYTGTVKNVYVSKDIRDLDNLFEKSKTLEYALFDENGTWRSMTGTFFETTKFHVTNYGFEFPQRLTDMSNTFDSSEFNDADMEAIKDKIPDTVTDMQNTFSGTQLTKIPEGFKLPKELYSFVAVFENTQLKTVDKNMILPSTVQVAAGVFGHCSSLETVPAGLFSKMAGSSLDVSYAFYGDKNLRGYIEMPKENISYIESIFEGAGTESENLPNYSTPIVMVYNSGDSASKSYATTYSPGTNIYDPVKNSTGKVTAITYDDYKLDISFEKVSGEGPYKDADGTPYYVRYVGTDKRVDLEDFTQSDGYVYWNGMKLNSTYKLFENATEIDRVLLPESFKDVKFESNMFEGTTQDIQLIYKDERFKFGDKSDTVFTNKKVIPYYYTDPNTYWNVTEMSLKNIFIPSEWDLSVLIENDEKLNDDLQYVLFDEKGNPGWTNFDSLFKGKPNFHTTNYGFDIPDTVTSMKSTFECSEYFDNSNFGDADMQAIKDKLPSHLTTLKSAFKGTKITTVPSDFNIPDTVTDTSYMFTECRSLKTVEDGFQLPDNVTDTSYMFVTCTSLENIGENFKLPVGVKDMTCMFDGCESLESVPQNMLKDVERTIINHAFRSCLQLRGLIYMPNDIENNNSSIFYYAAEDVTDKYGTYPTPIVVVYNGSSSNLSTSLSFPTNNIYTEINIRGKVLALTYEEYEASITTNSLMKNQETSVQSEIKAEPIEESITIQVEVREPEVKDTDQDKVENLNQVQSDDVSMLIKDVYEKNDYVDWMNKGNTDYSIKKRQRMIERIDKYKT